jgi:hypothetical protein
MTIHAIHGFVSRTARARVLAAAVAASLALGAGAARAEEERQPVDSEAGIGVAAGLVSLVYTPAKVLYALGGGVAAGMAYLASAGDQSVTEPILTPSLRGDYVVTPEHLRGERSLEFFGRHPTDAHGARHAEAPPVSSGGDGLDGATSDASAGSDLAN